MTHYYTLFIVYLLPHNSQDQLGEELYDASSDGDVEQVTRLLRQGAPVNWASAGGWTALHWVTGTKRPEVVKVLLKYNPHVNKRTVSGETPLHRTCRYGQLDCAKLLLATGQCDLG